MSEALNLYRLQQIDNQVDKTQNRLTYIVNIVEGDSPLRELIEVVDKLEKELTATERSQLELEEEIRNIRIKIDQTESNLYGGVVKNPRELQDLQLETGSLKRYLVSMEEKLLEAMDMVDGLKIRKIKANENLTIEQNEWMDKCRVFTQEGVELQKNLGKLEIERNALIKSISADRIALYEHLRKIRKGVAVSSINENACSACGTILTLALIQSSHNPVEITHCPACGRILYSS